VLKDPASLYRLCDPLFQSNVTLRITKGTLASRAEVPEIMPYYRAIRSFLSNHQGYYCAECLAARLNLSVDEIRCSVGQRTLADVTIAYRICQSCLNEKAVFALRMSA